ncbi:response regulator transcription factor [Metabacillus arenae]|uniref:Response regulator n=1 Tax=Metabacillus arenae TaxID=2771434 RepID=A0A926NDX4_9BACI|nr:response regulator [Metabacillus arenae]MBD1382477.1 response regulator [Metabacillus arenae]
MYKVLLVDDEYEIRYGLINYFPWNTLGFEIAFECQNGKEAIDIINTNSVDVLFSDIRMPVMTGIELAEEIVKRELPIKIVFLSAYREFDYAKKAINFGVYDYVVKPSKYEELQTLFTRLKKDLDQERTNKNSEEETVFTYSDNIISTIKAYVKEHYDSVNLEDVASLVHMSANYISTYFKEKTGQNFSDYVSMVKMEKAAELLSDYRYKTYEVSTMVGYSNAKNFTRMFKKYHGKSPREFRSG